MTDYRHTNGLRGTVLADPTYGTYLQMKLGLVPQTVLVDPDGEAVAVWPGSIEDGPEAEIETAIRSLAASRRGNSSPSSPH
jgi:hypothetical protein